MAWEEIVPIPTENLEQYDNRAGFDLVCCQDVGLPVYKLTIDVLTQVRKPIPPIEEYVLKTIDAGITAEEDIAAFLGVEVLTAREAMVTLRQSEDIDLIAPEGSSVQVWQLTKKGQKTLTEAKHIVPEERTFDVYFDGLLRRPVWLGKSIFDLLQPKALRNSCMVEIDPSPKAPPEISDLNLQQVDAIIRKIEYENSRSNVRQERDLLALKKFEKRKRLFLPARALVYKAKDEEDIQISFLVDDILSNEHDSAFARSGGLKKLKIAEALQKSEPRQLAEEVLGDEFISQGQPDEVAEKAKKIRIVKTTIEEKIETLQEKIGQTAKDEEKKVLQQQLEEALAQIKQLESEIESVSAAEPLRWLQVYEHRPLLEKALKESKQRLMIISPWIRAVSVNDWFFQKFETLLRRGVKIWIGYGYDKEDGQNLRKRNNQNHKFNPADKRAKQRLQDLSDKYSDIFTFQNFGDTHAKILISDSQFAVVTSFNWLSFKGDPKLGFKDERGTLVSDSDKVDELYHDWLKRFAEDSDSR